MRRATCSSGARSDSIEKQLETQVGVIVIPNGTSASSIALREIVPGVDLEAVDHPGISTAVWFHAAGVQEIHDALVDDGYSIVAAPIDGPFGRTFTFADPDGYRITLRDRA